MLTACVTGGRSVSARTLFCLVLVAMLVVSEAAPQFRGRGGRRRFRPNRRNQNRNRFNQIGGLINAGNRFFNNGRGSSNTQANANVVQGTNGNTQTTLVNANVLNQQTNSPGNFGLSGGVALASNFQFNSPFGNINLSNAQAQTVNRQQNLGNFFRG